MKILILILLFSFSLQASEKRGVELFAAPQMGMTSISSSYKEEPDNQFSYGLEAILVKRQWAAGLNYSAFAQGPEGSDQINVFQDFKWISIGPKWRFWDENFSPYLLGNVGLISQTVVMRSFNDKEPQAQAHFVYDLGLGFLGRITEKIGVNGGVKFYRFSNYSGVQFFVSIGFYLPDFF